MKITEGLSENTIIWLMRLVCFSAAFLVTIFSVFEEMMMFGGPLKSYILLGLISTSCALYGPMFKKYWYGSIDQIIGASLITALLTNGTAWATMVVFGVLFFGDPASELINMPKMFLSGGLLAPLTIMLYPLSILVICFAAVFMIALGKTYFRLKQRNKKLKTRGALSPELQSLPF